MIRLISVFVFVLAMTSGCGLYQYQVDVQQGNFVTPELIAQVRPGMSQSQVRQLLGTPLMTDDFRRNRWDYVFYRKEGRQAATNSGVTIFFGGNGTVNRVVKN